MRFRIGWYITSRLASVSKAESATTKHLIKKHVKHIAVAQPTSCSFFLRPLDSIGNRLSIKNSLPPYSRKPNAAKNDITATNSFAIASATLLSSIQRYIQMQI